MNPPPTELSDPPVATLHPLEPLTGEEFVAATAILRRETGLGPAARMTFISLKEPAKDVIRAWEPGVEVPREAHIVYRNIEDRSTNVAVVSLTDDTLLSNEVKEGVQAALTGEEFEYIESTCKAHPDWQAAMRKRGITDFDLCMLDPWPSSYQGPDDHPGLRRIARPLTWVKDREGAHGYARPVDGVVCVMNLDTGEVVVEDHGIVPIPEMSGNYVPELMNSDANNVTRVWDQRRDVKPIEITQPEGPSFTVDGHHVRWQKWDFRIGFTMREGIVLHRVGYWDGDPADPELRPMFHRISLAEMFIPYADPSPTQNFKNVFDMGEVGVGWLANPLELGCDCLGDITYLDGVCHDQDGEPMVIPNAICMHEEDYGFGWKHTDFRNGEVEVRRLRRLVVSMIATVGNYEYGFFWHLYTDGTIEFEAKLSGVLSTGAYDPAKGDPKYGAKLAPGLFGAHHQHFFCVRIDPEIDGPANRVVEVDSVPLALDDPDNPYGNGWTTRATVLDTELAGERVVDPSTSRFWKIESSERKNLVGGPTAYKIEPGATAFPLQNLEGNFAKRGAFNQKTVWVTPYAEDERYPAGDFPYQHPGGQGIPEWTAQDRPTADTDVVLWYTFCAHHIVRMEDWPVMPAHHIGFKLKPTGFFNGNPSLDMPRSTSGHTGHCHHGS
ncbi:MAG: primary-amine oxidase [Solirubrobacteraceae bacterium]|nr:primary-amine oxidase [Solirubrobacteraceae bacterium]